MMPITGEPNCPAVTAIHAGLPAPEDHGAMPELDYLDDEVAADDAMREAEDDYYAYWAAVEAERAAARAAAEAERLAWEAARDPDDDGTWDAFRSSNWVDWEPQGDWDDGDA